MVDMWVFVGCCQSAPLDRADQAFDLVKALLQQVDQLTRSRTGIVSYDCVHDHSSLCFEVSK